MQVGIIWSVVRLRGSSVTISATRAARSAASAGVSAGAAPGRTPAPGTAGTAPEGAGVFTTGGFATTSDGRLRMPTGASGSLLPSGVLVIGPAFPPRACPACFGAGLCVFAQNAAIIQQKGVSHNGYNARESGTPRALYCA